MNDPTARERLKYFQSVQMKAKALRFDLNDLLVADGLDKEHTHTQSNVSLLLYCYSCSVKGDTSDIGDNEPQEK